MTPLPVLKVAGGLAAFADAVRKGLWCICVPGPDDIYAAASVGDAMMMATMHNAAIMRRVRERPLTDFDVPLESLLAVVEPWPWSAEAHAENLRKFAGMWGMPEMNGRTVRDVIAMTCDPEAHAVAELGACYSGIGGKTRLEASVEAADRILAALISAPHDVRLALCHALMPDPTHAMVVAARRRHTRAEECLYTAVWKAMVSSSQQQGVGDAA